MYWVIHQEDLQGLLERAASGEDVSLLLLEFYGNSEVVTVTEPETS